MADLPLSATSCECGTTGCDTFSCCEPTQYKTLPCTIQSIQGEICIDYDLGEPFAEETSFEAIIVDENCDTVVVTEDCVPIYGRFLIN